jgi:hypothetical protein
MLSLAQYLEANSIGKSEFARRLSVRLGERVPPQSIHRWTVNAYHPDYCVPQKRKVEAIEAETNGEVGPASWYGAGRKPRKGRSTAVSVAAARKAADSRRRMREARA